MLNLRENCKANGKHTQQLSLLMESESINTLQVRFDNIMYYLKRVVAFIDFISLCFTECDSPALIDFISFYFYRMRQSCIH